jgi:hypothetical protein
MVAKKESPDNVVINPTEIGHKTGRQGKDAPRETQTEISVKTESISVFALNQERYLIETTSPSPLNFTFSNHAFNIPGRIDTRP